MITFIFKLITLLNCITYNFLIFLHSFAHFASYVRDDALRYSGQTDHFLRAVGKAVLDTVGPSKLWVSTSGAGVYWLHLRLDSYPKYYTYSPYRGSPHRR